MGNEFKERVTPEAGRGIDISREACLLWKTGVVKNLLMVCDTLLCLVQTHWSHYPQVTRMNVSTFISHIHWENTPGSELLRNSSLAWIKLWVLMKSFHPAAIHKSIHPVVGLESLTRMPCPEATWASNPLLRADKNLSISQQWGW